jgi:hypothetical protein
MAKPNKGPNQPIRAYIPLDSDDGWRHRRDEFKELWSNKDIVEIYERIEQLVYQMALDGCPMTTIADLLAVPRDELIKLFAPAWRQGKAEVDALLYRKIVSNGLDTNQPVNAIFAAKAIAGMSDSHGVTLSIEDSGADVNVNVNVISAKPEGDVDG